MGTILAAGIFASGQRYGDMARQAGIWIAVIVILTVGYEYRFELQDSAGRVASALVPGLPVSTQSANGDIQVTLNRRGRHFVAVGKVNGTRQSFLIDTGASTVVLTEANAEKAGYETRRLNYVIPVSTANGTAMAARISGVELAIGGIERRNMDVLVAKDSQLASNLLGMSFLDSLSSYEVQRDKMVLRD